MASTSTSPSLSPRAAARTNVRALPALLVAAALAASAALGWLAGGASGAGDWVRAAFESYVDAQLVMVRASSNVNDDGEAEYAVVASEGLDVDDLEQLAADDEGVRFLRESVLPGSAVLALDPGDRDALARLRADPRVRLAVANRGLWICH